MSVNNDRLLVSAYRNSFVYVYNNEGVRLDTINVTDQREDASWTPRGNIVYTTLDGFKVVTLTSKGALISSTKMAYPNQFTMSTNGNIYLGNGEDGVYQSADDGLTWSKVFRSSDKWVVMQAIAVKSENEGTDFFTLEYLNDVSWVFNPKYRIRLYMLNKQHSGLTWRDVIIASPNGRQLDIYSIDALTYDNRMNIFMCDTTNNTINIYSVLTNQLYELELLLPLKSTDKLLRLAIDTKQQMLYVLQKTSTVSIFKLTYDV